MRKRNVQYVKRNDIPVVKMVENSKVKNFCGYPKQSIDYCLSYLRENNRIVDKVAFSTINLVGFFFAYPIQHYFKMTDYHRHYGEAFYGKK